MKKTDKKTLSLSRETLRNLRADDLGRAAGGLPAQTVAYSWCWSCGSQGAARGCCANTSAVSTGYNDTCN